MIVPILFPFLRIAAPLVLLCSWACTTSISGRNFSRPDYPTYSKERITESDITKRYGQPYSRNKFTNHGVTIGTLDYLYVVSEWNVDDQLHRRKTCSFYFYGGHYLGYQFGTGFQEEQAPLEERKLSQLVKGQTSKADALAMFGAPTSALRYPATPEEKSTEGDSIVSYKYNRYSAQGTSESYQFLMLTFGADNVLKRVDFDARERAPIPPPADSNKQEPMHWGAAPQPRP